MAKSTNKVRAVDLGLLQSTFETAKKTHIANGKTLERAQDAHDASGRAFTSADTALKQGLRSVTS